jgi:hypothetical protein
MERIREWSCVHRVDKIRFTLVNSTAPEEEAYGYVELNREGHMFAIYNKDGEEMDLYGGHEFVIVRALGKFDEEDRDNFYDLLERDGIG